jgi:hypothetical protein
MGRLEKKYVKDWPDDPEERASLMLGLQKAIVSRFSESDWKELGYETGTIEWINNHPRLLRSLSFGDGDYGSHVFEALEMLSKSNRHSLEILLGKEKIYHHLQENSPEIFSLYIDSSTPVPEFKPRVTPTQVVLRAIEDAEMLIKSRGPVSAVDRVHTALHGYLIGACENLSPSKDAGIVELYKLLRENHPRLKELGVRSEDLNKILRSLTSILDALNPLRNRGSLAHANESLIGDDEAMLAINSARTILHYIDAKVSGF